MDNQELEKKIKASCRNIAPDILDSVLEDCDLKKGAVIVMQEGKKKRSFGKYIAAAAVAVLLVAVGVLGTNLYHANRVVASTVMLDVNPSIEIQVNKKEEVLNIKPLNEDAKTVIGEMDFTGSALDVTVNALIGSMLRNGFITEASNSILVTVDSDDPVAGVAMQEKLMTEIDGILASGNVSAAVLGQTVTKDSESQSLADEYGITEGKAKLIQQITEQNSMYSFEELVPLTINELNLISASAGSALPNVESLGTASAASYVGEQAAKKAAFEHAGVNAGDVILEKCELDWENGKMVYEVVFYYNGFEYEYDIDATNGSVIAHYREVDDDYYYGAGGNQNNSNDQQVQNPVVTPQPTQAPVTPQPTQAPATPQPTETPQATPQPTETPQATPQPTQAPQATPQQPQQSGPTATIDAATAKATALAHAGVSNVTEFECELDNEHGRLVYEISFKSGGFEYDYEISATDGSILKSEREID